MLLRKWVEDNEPAKDLFWRDGFFQQTNFVGTMVAWCLTPKWLEENYDRLVDRVDVVSVHTSKSVKLPVYRVVTHNGAGHEYFRLTFRNNFYNWNVSVEANAPLTEVMGFHDLGVVSDDQGYCFCEGMEEWKYGPHNNDPTKFTFCVQNDYDFYVFCRALRHHYGLGRESLADVAK